MNDFTCMYSKYEIPVLLRSLSNEVKSDTMFNEDNWYLTLAFAGIWVQLHSLPMVIILAGLGISGINTTKMYDFAALDYEQRDFKHPGTGQ